MREREIDSNDVFKTVRVYRRLLLPVVSYERERLIAMICSELFGCTGDFSVANSEL